MLLPAGSAARVAGKRAQRETGQDGEAALDSEPASGLVDDAERLVKPDGGLREQTQDQRLGDPRFGFRDWPWPGVQLPPRPAKGTPAPSEIAVEVNAVRILPGCGGAEAGADAGEGNGGGARGACAGRQRQGAGEGPSERRCSIAAILSLHAGRNPHRWDADWGRRPAFMRKSGSRCILGWRVRAQEAADRLHDRFRDRVARRLRLGRIGYLAVDEQPAGGDQ